MLEKVILREEQLEDNILKERNRVKHLQYLLETERQHRRSAKLTDTEIIEVRSLFLVNLTNFVAL
jgi:hypothetical protein